MTETITRRRPRVTYDPELVRRGKAILDSMPEGEREWYLAKVRDSTFTLAETHGMLAVGESMRLGREEGTRRRSVREGLEALS